MKLYPLFADLRERAVLVVGGGVVAERKVAALLAAGATLTLGAPRITTALRQRVKAGQLRWLPARFEASWLDEAWLVVAATDDRDLHRRIAEQAKMRKLFVNVVNVVDDAELSSFHVPALIDRSPLLIAISSGGDAPMLARLLRERLETLLDHSLGALAALAGELRQRIRSRLPDAATRRRFYESLFAGSVATALRRGQPAAARREAERLLEAQIAPHRGSVVLVGAGPGDPGLLTLAGLRALNEADVILHDRLVSAEVLGLARRDAERIEVGKQAGGHQVSQARIHELLLEHARAGKRVVRLKGGDPFVFGRGGEELEFLAAHGIPFEVVPGITAALACAAYAGIPLTHRDHAQSVRLLTAHGQDSQHGPDWLALARERQTLAIYMGVAELAKLQRELLAHGRAADTPFALIERGSQPQQRVVLGTLGELTTRARAYAVESPALLILGEVAALASTLAWYGSPPLGASTRLLQDSEPLATSSPARLLQAIHQG